MWRAETKGGAFIITSIAMQMGCCVFSPIGAVSECVVVVFDASKHLQYFICPFIATGRKEFICKCSINI